MADQQLVLVRHAMPEVRPGESPAGWELGERAREDCVLLAHALRDLRSPSIVTSPEPKASQTADVLGLRLGCWPSRDERLREVRRPWVNDLAPPVARYLEGDDLPGWERRSQVIARFGAALVEAAGQATQDVIVVTHGLALALYLDSLHVVEPLAFWESLEFPCALSLDTARGTLMNVFPNHLPH